MHQFIGDLISSGNGSKVQPDVLNTVWGVAGGGDEAPGFKSAPGPSQDKPEAEPSRQTRPGASQRKGAGRGRREGKNEA